ncbi:hypothetical protein EV651_1247 [Kribbella sp. VKM Ac-2571]|uniref:hypothetical protein n=1 Tax=Kribbella sp. VKM Ac-2571 TaxID=2512222 RepID=UPI00105D294D|nr:hypothetical protein [Kribbella sp. VKM Ac-2571]TDO47568.1 hypothetical protein EV651_1247 [Kribbella sp. VKM Ac-2571]
MSDLGSRFVESRGEPIALDGRFVHMSHVMAPLPAGVLKVRMRATGDLEQGVGIRADGGWLTVNGEKAKQFALWTVTAPNRVEIDVKPVRGRQALSVRIWNIWKHEHWGSTMAWVSNAGLLVEPRGNTAVILYASAGPGEPTFDDLTVDVTFERA